jgi:hypothetical protein
VRSCGSCLAPQPLAHCFREWAGRSKDAAILNMRLKAPPQPAETAADLECLEPAAAPASTQTDASPCAADWMENATATPPLEGKPFCPLASGSAKESIKASRWTGVRRFSLHRPKLGAHALASRSASMILPCAAFRLGHLRFSGMSARSSCLTLTGAGSPVTCFGISSKHIRLRRGSCRTGALGGTRCQRGMPQLPEAVLECCGIPESFNAGMAQLRAHPKQVCGGGCFPDPGVSEANLFQ